MKSAQNNNSTFRTLNVRPPLTVTPTETPTVTPTELTETPTTGYQQDDRPPTVGREQ